MSPLSNPIIRKPSEVMVVVTANKAFPLSGNMIDSGVSESTMGLKIEKVFLLF
jgi:hypothetical protein